jgi:hypothetical protein
VENWVERRFLREQNLAKADDVWQATATAIHNACESFNKRYSHLAKVEIFPQNGHRILIQVTHESSRPNIYQATTKRSVVITFDPEKPCITSTTDGGPAKQFRIEADEGRCFLRLGQSEITPDACSQYALDDALFKPKQPHEASGSGHGGTWIS